MCVKIGIFVHKYLNYTCLEIYRIHCISTSRCVDLAIVHFCSFKVVSQNFRHMRFKQEKLDASGEFVHFFNSLETPKILFTFLRPPKNSLNSCI